MKPTAQLFLLLITAINIYIGSTHMYWCMNSVDEYLSKCGNTSTVRVFKDKDYYYIQLCPTIHNTCWNFTRLECQNIYDVCKSYLNLQGCHFIDHTIETQVDNFLNIFCENVTESYILNTPDICRGTSQSSNNSKPQTNSTAAALGALLGLSIVLLIVLAIVLAWTCWTMKKNMAQSRRTEVMLNEEEKYFKNPIYDGRAGQNTSISESSRISYDTVLDTPSSLRANVGTSGQAVTVGILGDENYSEVRH